MKLKDGASEVYMQYDESTRKFAETWATCIEINMKGGMELNKAIGVAHNRINTPGASIAVAALCLIINCWVYGDAMKEWYDNLRLLIDM